MKRDKQPRRPATGAERQARYSASGRQIACVIRDERAIAALDRLAEKHGGVTAAILALLTSSQRTHRDG
jgi:hypothetical protein